MDKNRRRELLETVEDSVEIPELIIDALEPDRADAHEGQKFVIGEIYNSPRSMIGDTPAYHHTVLVTKVDENGQVVEFIEFDPFETLTVKPTLNQLVIGVKATPRCSTDQELIRQIFRNNSLKKHAAGLKDLGAIEEMTRRKEEIQNKILTYKLIDYNCQHFATYIRDGTAISFESDAVDRALPRAIVSAAQDLQPFYETVAEPLLAVKPFSDENTLGWIGNKTLYVVFILLIMVLCCFYFMFSFGSRMLSCYDKERTLHVHRDDNEFICDEV